MSFVHIARVEYVIIFTMFVMLAFKFHKMRNKYKNSAKKLRQGLAWMFACSAAAFIVALVKTMPTVCYDCDLASVVIGLIMLLAIVPFFKEVN